MAAIVVERRVQCRSDPRALWCVITDTEQLNRAVGLGKIDLTPNDDETASRYVVNTVSGGFELEYEERPFEWIENERFSVRRDVRKGLAQRIDNTFELLPKGKGTELLIRIEVVPKYRVLSPVMRAQVGKFADRIAKQFRQIDSDLSEDAPASYRQPGSLVNVEALNRAAELFYDRIDDHLHPVAKKLVEMVSSEPDANVDRIRPFELAEKWDFDGRRVLAACLHGVVAGLFELSWDIICPSCVTASDRIGSLENIGTSGHCQLCDITFELELDRAVEATFRPATGLRRVDGGPYCIGGPARTPHVIAQSLLPARGHVVLRAPTENGKYRLFVRGGANAPIVVREDGASEVTVAAPPSATDLDALVLAPGATIRVEQPRDVESHVKLERVGWKAKAATANIVATMPEFRRLFSHEVLRAGNTLRIGRITFLFTDLTESTALYKRLGDAKAFKVIQDHFDLLQEVIDGRSGAIIKTMGDAIMAAFNEERDAIGAAIAMQERFHAFQREHEAPCCLKIGVYGGACYCVTANGVLDYFGQTVNVAARLQGEAHAGEVVLTEQLASDAVEHGWLGDHTVGERFEASLKGVGIVSAARILIGAHTDS